MLDYADYLVNFELFFRDIRNLHVLFNQDLDFVKVKTKEAGLHLTELLIIMCLQIFLIRNSLLYKTSLKTDLIIQKSDKGNPMVIVDRQNYIKKIDNILIELYYTVVNLKDG